MVVLLTLAMDTTSSMRKPAYPERASSTIAASSTRRTTCSLRPPRTPWVRRADLEVRGMDQDASIAFLPDGTLVLPSRLGAANLGLVMATCCCHLKGIPMPWHHVAAYFLGGIFLANFFPHFIAGMSGVR